MSSADAGPNRPLRQWVLCGAMMVLATVGVRSWLVQTLFYKEYFGCAEERVFIRSLRDQIEMPIGRRFPGTVVSSKGEFGKGQIWVFGVEDPKGREWIKQLVCDCIPRQRAPRFPVTLTFYRLVNYRRIITAVYELRGE